MKIKLLLLIFFGILINFTGKAQIPTCEDSLAGFDLNDGYEHAMHIGKTGTEATDFINQAKRNYINRKYHLDKSVLPVSDLAKKGVPNSVSVINCATDNYGFELGNTNGWTMSGTGVQTIVSAGTDPYGAFPWVCPLNGSSYSLRLSNDVNSGCCLSSATKSIPVPAAGTTFFTFYFALAIFGYPHTAADAATFSVDFYTAGGALIPCPQFLVYHSTDGGDVGVHNFAATPNPAISYNPGCAGDQSFNSNTIYAPWQGVTADLTPYAGTTITAVFTVKWCVFNVDWLYALIDADCPLNYIPPPSTCVTLPYNLCGPPEMATYSWNTPSGGTGNASCINAITAGVYSLTCSPALTCGSPNFTYTYNVQPIPTANFTSTLPTCTSILTATDNSTLNGATVSSYSWDYGDATTGTGSPTNHTYGGMGTFNVTETITTTDGCTATVTNPVTVTNPMTVTVPGGTICNGGSLPLTASGGGTTYNWFPGAGLSATTGANVTANPTSTTIYTITGSNGACTNTTTCTVTVNPLPVITVASATVCSGTPATIMASGATTYTWNTGATTAALTQILVTTTNYIVTGTDGNGCTNTATTTITVNPLPPVAVNSSTICIGQQTATLTASGALTYSWNPTTGLTPTIGSPVTGTPTTTTNYIVTGTDGNGCTNTATTTITVNPLPPVAVNSSTICIGQQTATLTASGALTYSWNPTTGLTPTIGSPVTGTPTTTTNYIVTGTDGNGCTNTATTTITVNPLPPVAVNSSTICIGQQTATLTASGALTYSWNPTTGLTPTIGSPVTGTPTTTTNYIVTGTDGNGCTNTATTTITVNPLPPVAVNSSTICIGQQTATLTASGALTYSWNPTTGLTPTIGSPVTGTPTTTTNYIVTGTDGNGCTNMATTTITVNSLPLPIATSNTPCASQQVLSFSCMPNGLLFYSWSGPNSYLSPLQNPSIPTASVTVALAGIYTVSVTDVNTCTNTATVDVNINPLPVVTVNSPTVCENQTINLVASGGVIYSWFGPNAYMSGIPNPSISNAVLNMSGSYVVTVTDVNACVNANVAQVVVNPLPVINANVASICMGQQSATLTATGAYTYTWAPSNTLSSNFGSSVIAIPNATTNYIVNGIDVNGCENITTTTVTVYPIPIVTTSTVSPTCVPLNATFSVTSNPAASSYIWSFGNGPSQTSTLNPSSSAFITNTIYTAAGTYPINLTITDIHGCVGSATTIAVAYPIPIADFDYGQQPVTILAPEVQFYNESVYAAQNVWNLGDPGSNSNIDSVVNPSHTYLWFRFCYLLCNLNGYFYKWLYSFSC